MEDQMSFWKKKIPEQLQEMQEQEDEKKADNLQYMHKQYPSPISVTTTGGTGNYFNPYQNQNMYGGQMAGATSVTGAGLAGWNQVNIATPVPERTIEWMVDLIVARTTAMSLDTVRQIVREELERAREVTK
jgi:hypothetical protein